jgi:hypothetical protein
VTRFALAILLPVAAHAQLVLMTGSCTTGSAIGSGSFYNFGQVAAGATKDVSFFACNSGSASVTITALSVSGSGFSISAVNGSVPGVIAPANFLQFTVHFASGTAPSYSASLTINSITVYLQAAVVPAPQLVSGCGASSFSFGNVQIGKPGSCSFSLQNPPNAPALTVSLTGAGFNSSSLPATVAPGAALTFIVQLTPVCGTTKYSGTLTAGAQSYALTGTGFAALPSPSLVFDTNSVASGEQHTLTMNLSTPYPCGANDVPLALAFAPSTTVVSDDPTIVFVAGNTRNTSLHFDTGVTQASVVFNTGSTAGTITFSVPNTAVQTTLTIPPATISIQTAAASNQVLGQLNIEIIGSDNTYTAGAMSFTFFDTGGKAIGGAVNADFTSNFKTYFTTGQASGSSFLLNVSFPVTGPQTQVGSVAVTLTNSAGQAQTGNLTFQ